MQRITNDRDPRDPRPGPRAQNHTQSHQISPNHTLSHKTTQTLLDQKQTKKK